MKPGERMDTAIFGQVTVSELFLTEPEARAAGYYMDAHVKGYENLAWKVLYDGDRFAAVRCLKDREEKMSVRRTAPAPPVEAPKVLVKTTPKQEKKGQLSLFD